MGLLEVADSSTSIILSSDITKFNELLTRPFPECRYLTSRHTLDIVERTLSLTVEVSSL